MHRASHSLSDDVACKPDQYGAHLRGRTILPADIYLCINGDEPLIDPNIVEQVIPNRKEGFFAANLMTKIHSPVEVVDETNIKVVTDEADNALFLSRSPIPHPKASVHFDYYKHLGVLAYSMEALRFFAETPKGALEKSRTSTNCALSSMGESSV